MRTADRRFFLTILRRIFGSEFLTPEHFDIFKICNHGVLCEVLLRDVFKDPLRQFRVCEHNYLRDWGFSVPGTHTILPITQNDEKGLTA